MEEGTNPLCHSGFSGICCTRYDGVHLSTINNSTACAELLVEQPEQNAAPLAENRVKRDFMAVMLWKTSSAAILDKALDGFQLGMQMGYTMNSFLFVNYYAYHYFYWTPTGSTCNGS